MLLQLYVGLEDCGHSLQDLARTNSMYIYYNHSSSIQGNQKKKKEALTLK